MGPLVRRPFLAALALACGWPIAEAPAGGPPSCREPRQVFRCQPSVPPVCKPLVPPCPPEMKSHPGDLPEEGMPNVDPMADPMVPDARNDFPAEPVNTNNLPQVASTTDTVAPNNIGDLLRAYRGISYGLNSAGLGAAADSSGTVSFRNTKVSENNSAVPRDRVGFRINYFENAISQRGIERDPTTTPVTGIQTFNERTTFGTFNVNAQGQVTNPQVFTNDGGPFVEGEDVSSNNSSTPLRPATRDVDAILYTINVEKTFFDGEASLEFRLPYLSTLQSDLDLVAGNFNNVAFPGNTVTPTPEQTFGGSDTELQDVQLIYKHILYENRSGTLIVAGGLGVNLPTGPDLRARVVDFSQDDFLADRDAGGFRFVDSQIVGGDIIGSNAIGQLANGFVDATRDRRTRWFEIENQTVGLSPFVALAAQPTRRSWVNGFAQLDVPLNSSRWRYAERDTDLDVLQIQNGDELAATQLFQGNVNNPILENSSTGTIYDQFLLHLDIGGGYWWYLADEDRPRDGTARMARWVRGLGSAIELHYTTTLNDADLDTVDAAPIFLSTFDNNPGPNDGDLFRPVIGNTDNRLDIVNLTLGQHVQIGRDDLFSFAYVVPLSDESNRTFDWEMSAMLNIYFGNNGGNRRPPAF